MTTTTPIAPGDVLLPRPPGVLRRWVAAHPRFIDGFIVGAYLFGCALAVTFDLIAGAMVGNIPDVDPRAAETLATNSLYLTWPWLIVSILIIAVVALALAYRRRFPLAGVVLVALLMFLEQGLLVGPNSVALVFLLYAVPVFASVRAGWVAFSIAFVLSMVATQLTGASGTGLFGPFGIALADDMTTLTDQAAVTAANGLWLLVVLMIGINLGNRRRYVEALIERAHQLAMEREQRAQLAAVAERSRIAREMHDIVAHSLSVVVTLSEAAAVAIDTQPAAAKDALERSAETGRHALMEMRRLLGILNEEGVRPAEIVSGNDGISQATDAPHSKQSYPSQSYQPPTYAPQPGFAQLPELLENFRAAGLNISLTQEGATPADAAHQLAVYRIAQEGLTNALRHAGPGTDVELSVTEIVDAEAPATRIEVVDSGSKSGDRAPHSAIPGAGRGLAGAAERAQMFGGTLESGPHGEGWRLVARVPFGGVSERPPRSNRGVESGGDG